MTAGAVQGEIVSQEKNHMGGLASAMEATRADRLGRPGTQVTWRVVSRKRFASSSL